MARASHWLFIGIAALFALCAFAQDAPLPPGVSMVEEWETRYYRFRYYEDPLRKVKQSSNLMRVMDNFLSGERTVEMTGITDDEYWFPGHRDNFTLQQDIAFKRMFNQFNYSGTPFKYCSAIVNTIPGLLNHSSEPAEANLTVTTQPGNVYQTNYTRLRGELINSAFPGIQHYPTSVLHGAASANQWVLLNIKPRAQGPIPKNEVDAYCRSHRGRGMPICTIPNLFDPEA